MRRRNRTNDRAKAYLMEAFDRNLFEQAQAVAYVAKCLGDTDEAKLSAQIAWNESQIREPN